MVKYKITFEFDIDEILDQADNVSIEIEELNDKSYYDAFSSKEKIKKFESWFNAAESDNEKIQVFDIKYEGDYDNGGIVVITLESEYEDLDMLKESILDYLFDIDWPTITAKVSGTTYEDYWDYKRSSPEQRSIDFDTIETYAISSYKNDKISKI